MKAAAGLARRLEGVEEARVSKYWKGGMEQGKHHVGNTYMGPDYENVLTD
jgi:hypothetical protein